MDEASLLHSAGSIAIQPTVAFACDDGLEWSRGKSCKVIHELGVRKELTVQVETTIRVKKVV